MTTNIELIQLIFINKSVDFSYTFFPRFIYTIINIKYTIYLYIPTVLQHYNIGTYWLLSTNYYIMTLFN